MRIDSEPRSPHFWQRHFKNPSVTLNGVEQEDVVIADSDAGYVTCIAKDSAGNPCHAGGEYITVVTSGVVVIQEAADAAS